MADRYRHVDDWLDDARQVLAARIGALLTASAPSTEAVLAGFIASADARATALSLRAGPLVRAPDPPEIRAAADRLGDPAALAGLPVGRLLAGFRLPATVAPLLAMLAVAEVDARFGPLFAYLNDDAQRRHPTPALAGLLVGPLQPPPVDCLAEGEALRAYGMVELGPGRDRPLTDRPLRLGDHLARRLTTAMPAGTRDPALAGHLRDVPSAPLEALVSDPDRRHRLLAAAEAPLTVLTGVPGAGRTVVAVALAEARGRPHLTVAGDSLATTTDPLRLLRIAVREATLDGAVLVVTAADTLPRPAREAALGAAPCPVILLAPHRLDVEAPQPELPPFDPPAAAVLWRQALGPARTEVADRLAHRFRLPPSAILGIARAEPGAGPERLAAACVERSATALDALATRVETRCTWDDIVLPRRQTDKLRGIVARASHARTVYEDWAFGRKLAPAQGLTALFSGPSGAGKTLSAGVVARALGLPLYRVDLSQTVSKYIGETEKNLGSIFAAAEAGNACLFFDECDALFGKRSEVSDAHDRYANIETSYLLQRLETHRGIVVLASNFPQNIDDAFARRIDVTVEFPMPDADHRRLLWERLLPPEAKADIDAGLLGGRFELSGGAIRNCLLTAAFLAAADGVPIGTEHCLRAVAQEYEKTGRPLSRAEFGSAFGGLRPRGGA